MGELLTAMQELREMNRRYGLSSESLDRLEAQFADAKVCAPIIGKFSSGKSALLNALLGYSDSILKENIAPETAVPVELQYTGQEEEQPVRIFRNSGGMEQCTLDEYRGMELDAGEVQRVQIALQNSSLGRFPGLQLVDMPGFESGYEVHNRAIDGYVGRSMAYLLTFPVDDMVLRSTTGNILKELCLHEMPLSIVLTKCDKVDSEEELQEKIRHLEASLKKYIGDRNPKWCRTSSHDGDIEDFRKMLDLLQDQAQDLVLAQYKNLLRPELANTARYLRARLNGESLTEVELARDADRLRSEAEDQARALQEKAGEFKRKIPVCVAAICGEVHRALTASEKTLVTMVMNKQEINSYLNFTVRNALTTGIQTHYLPMVETYLKDLSDTGLAPDLDVNVAMAGVDLEKNSFVGSIVAGTVGTIGVLTGAILVVFPLLAVIKMLLDKKKRKDAESNIRAKLNSEVFPEVLRQVEANLNMEISKHADALQEKIAEQRKAQQEVLDKSLADLRAQMEEEQAVKERRMEEVRKDLERLEEVQNGL